MVRTKPENAGTESKYGASFVKVGIPKPIVNKLMKKAHSVCTSTGLKQDTSERNEYYWLSSDCTKAGPKAVSYVGVRDNMLFEMNGAIDDAVTGTRINENECSVLGIKMENKYNFIGTMEFKLNMSYSRNGRGDALDFTNCKYTPSFKIREFDVRDVTQLGPSPFVIQTNKGGSNMTKSRSPAGAALVARIMS